MPAEAVKSVQPPPECPPDQLSGWQEVKRKSGTLRERTVVCYGISENDDMAGQTEHDVTAIKKLVSRALEDGEQLHIRQCVRIGARSGTRATLTAFQSQTNIVAV